MTVSGRTPALRADIAALRGALLSTGADVLEALVAAAQYADRDPFGRLVLDDPDVLSRAWLAAGVYEREVASTLLTGQWRDPRG